MLYWIYLIDILFIMVYDLYIYILMVFFFKVIFILLVVLLEWGCVFFWFVFGLFEFCKN